MKKLALKRLVYLVLIFIPLLSAGQQKAYFQQRADFDIRVSLDTVNKTLSGDIDLRYVNNSPDTLRYIWFHLWPNAYKNDQTAFSEQLLTNGRTDFYFSSEEKRGFIDRLNFTVDGVPASLEDHPAHIDVSKLLLPAPLPPGAAVDIKTPFFEKLPYLFSRGGYAGDFFMITQWYPKPAVYDREGWHPMPYLDQGEFYSEFGDYKVQMTVPKGFMIAATGLKADEKPTDSSIEVTYLQKDVHDFAWFAGRDLKEKHEVMRSVSGKQIQLFAYYRGGDSALWDNSLQFVKEAVRNREANLGEYGYPVISIVDGPDVFSGGMEYPTIAVVNADGDEKALNELINHEVGHNWTYGMLANNERRFPWMDEGMTSFYTDRFIQRKYRLRILRSRRDFIEKRLPENYDKLLFEYQVKRRLDQPVNLSSEDFSDNNYYASVYYKAPLWIQRLRDDLGEDVFLRSMHRYFDEWKFKHPYPEDFKDILEKTSGKNLDSMFHLLDVKGEISPQPGKQLKINTLFDFSQTDKYNYILLTPVSGFNVYDGIMIGAAIHNYTLPVAPFHFFLLPMYGTRDGKLNGIGRLAYSRMSYGKIRKFDISLAASKFDDRRYVDASGKKNYMDFYKIVPSLRLTFRNKNPLTEVKNYLQWKTYIINESFLNFVFDTVKNVSFATYPRLGRYLNELSFYHENNRVLYPFSYEVTGQQGDGFIRMAAEARQFYNYPGGGGLNARVFGGKLFYTNPSIPKSVFSRYQLNMSGPDGNEDYTYSDYFLGRNEFEGLASQQIMIRDGGFKTRTNLLNHKTGISDNWLAAANFDTDIPFFLPLSDVTDGFLKIKAFGDIGTYAGAWGEDAPTGKFLFDAGLQIDLIKGLVKIYFPLFYSKVYGDYYTSTFPPKKRFREKISFSIDIRHFSPAKFLDISY